MQNWQGLLVLLMASAVAACVPVRAIRTELPEQAGKPAGTVTALPAPRLAEACITGSEKPGEQLKVIEDYGSYVIGYAEFDDQGWSYSGESQLKAIQTRLQAEISNPEFAEIDFSVIVFVHGWHHNAHDNDCNVQEMRQMVSILSAQFDSAFHAKKLQRRRRVFGIYAGWRGESVDAPLLRYSTVIDRRNAAEKVAKGSIRQLLANLHVQAIAARQATHRTNPIDVADRMFTTVVGHSYGGLIVYNGLSQYLIDDLTTACTTGLTPAAGAPPSVWPDEVVLINPAFEASRFETLNRLAERSGECRGLTKLPLVTVITADNDQWTGKVFTMGRRISTTFEPYDVSTPEARRREKDSNIHAIGFVKRHQTHRLCLQSYEGAYRAIVYPIPPSVPGSVDVTRQVWVVGAPKNIVDGHNGFLFVRSSAGPQPFLLQWLISMHIPGSNVVASEANCART
jgi:pimeloyl-ACP methyl ester carboxylesterase